MAELDRFSLHPGDSAPAFDLPGTDGRRWALSDFSDSPMLVVAFWCNHCPYVQGWEGRMIGLAREFEPRGVRFVAVSSNDALSYPDDAFPRMVERAHAQGYPFPYLHDESQEVARKYGALVTPHPMLFGADRRLLYQGRIDDNHSRPDLVQHQYLREALETALARRSIEVAERPVQGCSIKWKG